MKKILLTFLFLFITKLLFASFILIPMDDELQKNHLKAYGITYYSLEKQHKVKWLLNYRGGSFLLEDMPEFRKECTIRGVSYEILSDAEALSILEEALQKIWMQFY